MMLRVNNEYLDFNQSIEQDRKARLFESIDEIEGDVSFEFEIELTSENAYKFGFPYPDSSSKTVYHKVTADLENNEGQLVSKGFVKVERKIGKTLFCSFFGGNSNWFSALTGNMTDLRLSQYDVEQTEANIRSSWSSTSGIVWPIIDTGGLSTRSFLNLKTEDFTPCFYVKTLFFELFQQSGLKITGELLDDWRYNNLIIATNGRSQEDIENRSAYVLKNSDQIVQDDPPGPSEILTFNDDINYPYFNGSQNNFNLTLNRYTADIKMRIKIDLGLTLTSPDPSKVWIDVLKNGATFIRYTLAFNTTASFQKTILMNLDAGDYVDIYVSSDPIFVGTGTITGGTIRITPTYLYYAQGSSSVPKWTKQDFVSSVLNLFNVVPAFDPYTRTVTLNLFDKIKSKEPIDVSEFIEEPEIDFSEFIADYGRNNTFKYQETDIDNLQEYNISTFIKYGAGVITADNDFIDESVEVLESDFSAPISYINGVFDMSMERIPFVEFDTEETEITSVTDPGFNIARFNVADDIFEVNDLVRIYDSTNESYNGEWVVDNVSPGWVQLQGTAFDTNATAKIEKLLHKFTTDDSVYLFINIPNYDLNDAAGGDGLFYINQNFFFSAGIAYFNLLNTGKQINTDYKQGLSFGSIVNPLFYQRTMLKDYWSMFGRILNDPVKLRVAAYLPWKIHNDIDFLRPLMIKTLETTNLYYCNRERGYNNSYTSCELELIKLP